MLPCPDYSSFAAPTSISLEVYSHACRTGIQESCLAVKYVPTMLENRIRFHPDIDQRLRCNFTEQVPILIPPVQNPICVEINQAIRS